MGEEADLSMNMSLDLQFDDEESGSHALRKE